MKKIRLSKSDVKELNQTLSNYSVSFSKKDVVEVVDDSLLFVNNKLAFIKGENGYFPFLKFLRENNLKMPKISVDEGAVRFVVKGADIMRPGIVGIEKYGEEQGRECGEGHGKEHGKEYVCIVDDKNRQPLAIGLPFLTYEEMVSAKSGKVIKNVHYVGDRLWKEH